MKYLGIEIYDEADIFKIHKENILKRANTVAKNTYSIIEKSCNKVLIGKTFWKGVALPSILMGAGVINFKQENIKKLQIIENGVYRKILGGGWSTPIVTLRGEMGSSMMESRIMENKILLVKSIIDGKNELMKEILINMRENKKERKNKNSGYWIDRLYKYLEKVGIDYREIKNMKKTEIRRKIREYDNKIWHEEMEKKSSIKMYRKYKKNIKQEKIYDNRWSSVLLFQARVNMMELNYTKRHDTLDTRCELCGDGYEDLLHFVKGCEKLENKRDKRLFEKYKGDSDEDTIGGLLFDTEIGDLEAVKRMLQNMWVSRKFIIENKGIVGECEVKERRRKKGRRGEII